MFKRKKSVIERYIEQYHVKTYEMTLKEWPDELTRLTCILSL